MSKLWEESVEYRVPASVSFIFCLQIFLSTDIKNSNGRWWNRWQIFGATSLVCRLADSLSIFILLCRRSLSEFLKWRICCLFNMHRWFCAFSEWDCGSELTFLGKLVYVSIEPYFVWIFLGAAAIVYDISIIFLASKYVLFYTWYISFFYFPLLIGL